MEEGGENKSGSEPEISKEEKEETPNILIAFRKRQVEKNSARRMMKRVVLREILSLKLAPRCFSRVVASCTGVYAFLAGGLLSFFSSSSAVSSISTHAQVFECGKKLQEKGNAATPLFFKGKRTRIKRVAMTTIFHEKAACTHL